MTIALTQNILKKLAEGFGLNSAPYNAIVAAAEKSPFLAGELNSFGNDREWKFSQGSAGSGVSTNSTDKAINFDPSWIESPTLFATTLAHELGHALLPGGTGGKNPTNPDEASQMAWLTKAWRSFRNISSPCNLA